MTTTLLAILPVLALATLLASAAIGLATSVLATRRPSTVPLAAGTGSDPAPAEIEDRSSPLPMAGIGLAAALLVAALLIRAAVAGRAPWSNLHEFSLAFGAALLLAHLAAARSLRIGALAPLVALIGAAVVAVALALDGGVDPLVPALQQPFLLTVHVGTAAVAYALAGLAFASAGAELAQGAAAGRIEPLPSVETLRAATHRAVLLAFPVLTVAIVLGAVWANLAWRSPWSNDPKELAAAATWLVFAAYLHVAGRRDRWAALGPWLVILGFAGVLFTYLGAGLLIVGEHSYGRP